MKLKDKFSNLVEKIKNSRKLQLTLVFSLFLVILIMYLTYSVSKSGETDTSTIVQPSSTTEEYISSLENKLENVLSNIEGAGKVSVAITVSSGFVYEYAYEETSKDSLSGSSSTSSLILIDNEPVIVSQVYPKIAGVLIIAEGGGKVDVKIDILQSIQTLLDVANENITILEGSF